MDLLTSPEIWIALLTLTALEIVLGIDNIISCRCSVTAFLLGLLRIESLRKPAGRFSQRRSFGLDSLKIISLQCRLEIRSRRLNTQTFLTGGLFTKFAQRFLRCVNKTIGLVSGIDKFTELAILLSMALGVTDHLFDFVVRQSA